MATMKSLAIQMQEKRATCVVLVPFGKTRFFKYRVQAIAYHAIQRAAGKPASIFPGV